ARDQGGSAQAERQGRKGQRPHLTDEVALRSRSDRWEPPELVREHDQQDHAKREDRHGDAECREAGNEVIDRPPTPECRDHARADTDDRTERQPGARQGRRERDDPQYLAHDGLIGPKGAAEVSSEDTDDEVDVLPEQWFVETHLRPQLPYGFAAGI